MRDFHKDRIDCAILLLQRAQELVQSRKEHFICHALLVAAEELYGQYRWYKPSTWKYSMALKVSGELCRLIRQAMRGVSVYTSFLFRYYRVKLTSERQPWETEMRVKWISQMLHYVQTSRELYVLPNPPVPENVERLKFHE